MSYGKIKRRRRNKRFFKVKQHSKKVYSVRFLGWLKIAIPLFMVVALLLGIGIPAYFYMQSNYTDLSQEGSSNQEYFTQEEQNELLMVVNKANSLTEDYMPNLVEFHGVKINKLALKDLDDMLNVAKKDGVNLSVSTGYIDFSDQQNLYEKTFDTIREQNGYSVIKSEAQAMKIVSKGGESENQTGLLISFADGDNSDFETSSSFSWLQRNAVDYGFVLRFPQDKEDVTTMSYNPQVYRFVGKSNALQMRFLDMTLEQYKNYLSEK